MFRFLLIVLFSLISFKTNALIEVDITRGNLNPLPIAVSPLSIDENSRNNYTNLSRQSSKTYE